MAQQKKHIRLKGAAEKREQALYYNQRHRARPLQLLLPGETMLTKLDHQKEWTTPTKVTGESTKPRSYVVEMQKGGTLA